MSPSQHVLRLALPALAALPLAVSALPRCDLAVQEGPRGPLCIDPAALDGRTVALPSNVTRIGRDGLALCGPGQSDTLASDIVYLIDHSRSMVDHAFWIDPANGDTAYFSQDEDCIDWMDTVGVVREKLRVRHYTWGDADDSSYHIPSSRTRAQITKGGCLESGDPYSMRAEVVRGAIRHQARLNAQSRGGMIGFHDKNAVNAGLRTLQGTGLARLVDSTGLHTPGGTKWEPPLKLAFSWLAAGQRNPVQAIILVSDGAPGDESAYRALLGPTSPPVYGVYLGKASATDDLDELDHVTSRTGGRAYVVPPDDPDSLSRVLFSIVGSVTVQESPSSSVLRNLTKGQYSRTLALAPDSGNTWRLELDSAIGLATGRNSMEMVSSWSDQRGRARTDTVRFVLDVAGAAAPIGTNPLAPSVFAARCGEATRLELLDSSWRSSPYLSEPASRFAVRMTTAPDAPAPLAIPATTRSGDAETALLARPDSLGGGTWGRLVPLSVARLVPAASGNGTVEVRNGRDTIAVSWCHPRDDRDCAADAIEVRSVRSATLRWVPSQTQGARGALVLEALLPGESGDSIAASVLRRGRALGQVALVCVGDSLFRATVPFRQGPVRPAGDTMWLPDPPAGAPDTLGATLVWKLTGETLADTALIRRPALVLALAWRGPGAAVDLSLQGGQSDASGTWPVRLSSGGVSQLAAVDAAGRGSSDVTVLAARAGGSLAWIRGVFVDPVYGDTAIDSVQVPVPQAQLRFVPRAADGPAGSLILEAVLPGVSAPSVEAKLERLGSVAGSVSLVRAQDSLYRGNIPFRQGPIRPLGDTLWMPDPPHGAPDTLAASVIWALTGGTERDEALVRRPPLSLALTRQASSSQGVIISLAGGTPDGAGQALIRLDGSAAHPAVTLDPAGPLAWNGRVDLADRMPESLDSLLYSALFVDPVYGDSATASIRLPSRWFAGRVEVQPSEADPRVGDTVEIVVRDRDPDSTRQGSIVLRAGRQSWTVDETGSSTGEYRLRLPADQVDSLWPTRKPRQSWSVAFEYVDPAHPADVARDTLTLAFQVPSPALSVWTPIASSAQGTTHPSAPLVLRKTQDGDAPEGARQGARIELWETVHVVAYLYDHLGVSVAAWEGDLAVADPRMAAVFVLDWNGRTADGQPAASGVYLMRVLISNASAGDAPNRILRFGVR